jgi:hypothetical protein
VKRTYLKSLRLSFCISIFLLSLVSCKNTKSENSEDNSSETNVESKPIPMSTYQVKKTAGSSVDIPWESATILENFSYPWEDDTPPALSFRALYDADKFYFKYEVEDARVLTYVDTNDKMEVVNSERVEIFFQVDEKLETYYCLEMDPLARVLDYKAAHYRNMTFDWKWPGNNLVVETKKTANGYELEGSITLQSLRDLGILKGNTMHAGLYRGECVKLEGDKATLRWISWIDPKTPEPDFHVESSFGEFVLE